MDYPIVKGPDLIHHHSLHYEKTSIRISRISKWHPTKNGELKPEKINYENIVVWWLCPRGQ